MPRPFSDYINSIQSKFNTGTATEHSYRSDLEDFIESLSDDIRAINEPAHVQCGAPDLAIWRGDFIVGHIEAKDIGVSLDQAERSEQLQRYRQALENLILTDYIEFRWYVKGDLRDSVKIARMDSRENLHFERGNREDLEDLLKDFLAHQPQPISTPRELAERMARLTHLIRDTIISAFEKDKASDTLKDWRQAFASVLIPDLDQPEHLGQFADMFAQTLSYGLFTARIMHQTGDFNRSTAQSYIPKTNPFLRDFFTYITGPNLSQEPYAGYVEDLIHLLALSDMHAILADFGRGNRQDDPMMHFYETFLAAYDPALREKRGVYYTPMPVVSFIVRSVDELLKTRFDLPRGLADINRLPDGTPKVLVLDPAVGTATFLYAVIDLIREEFMERNDAGSWSSYVRDHLLDRIFGFEIMMAPYAIAHFKLALELAGYDLDLPEEQRKRWAYDFQSDDRIQIYLTNTLEVLPDEPPSLIGPMRFVSQEASAADEVKQEKPIMVVLGNPPYAKFSNNINEYIDDLMSLYKIAVQNERNLQPLNDDYIKFIRFAHNRIEQTGYGIVGFITNHKYLQGLLQRGVREELLKSFDELFILNLHGNSNIGEGSVNSVDDENVFDIKQGVSISIFIKTSNSSAIGEVYYKELWGTREEKYSNLLSLNIDSGEWEKINPETPYYFFVPKDFSWYEEYFSGFSIEDIYPQKTSGIKTHRDHFIIDTDKNRLKERLIDLKNLEITDETIKKLYSLDDSKYWNLSSAREAFIRTLNWERKIKKYLYRPYDYRFIYYSSNFIDRDRKEMMKHLLMDNIALIADRTTSDNLYNHFFVSRTLVDVRSIPDYGGAPFIFPIYLYPESIRDTLFDLSINSPWESDTTKFGRIPNMSPEFILKLETQNGILFEPKLTGCDHVINESFGPEDILAYIYAILSSPKYRERYAEFLKIDFPRVPLTSDVDLFRTLVYLGRELIALHLMESPELADPSIRYPIPGNNVVAARGGYPKYTPPEGESGGRVYINREQYFEGIPSEVWEFEIGGYRVLHKWLKDRRGRELDYEDQLHYKKVVVALAETIRIMTEIDDAIPGWPIE
jgi:predicted helicase